MERKKNEALGRTILTKKVDMSVFVRTLVYEVRTAAQSVAGAIAHSVATTWAGADASASVGAGAEATAAARDGAPCRAGAGVEQVPVSMPDPPVDQPDPLMWSVPNPQLDQTELLPLSVLEQVPSKKVSVLDPLLKVVPMCETAAIVSGLV